MAYAEDEIFSQVLCHGEMSIDFAAVREIFTERSAKVTMRVGNACLARDRHGLCKQVACSR